MPNYLKFQLAPCNFNYSAARQQSIDTSNYSKYFLYNKPSQIVDNCFSSCCTSLNVSSENNFTEEDQCHMFRSRRNSLVKRLWSLRISAENEAESENEKNIDTCEEWKTVIYSVLRRLKEKQLECLLDCLESKGGKVTYCVLLPREHIKIGRTFVSPHVLCCQMWRWPQISSEYDLRRLSCCETADDKVYICCNPFHWSFKLKTEIDPPPPPYSDLVLEQFFNKSGTENEIWCNLAYWEYRQRMGSLFGVHNDEIDIFQYLPHGSGMSLDILQSETANETVKKTREKIGFGINLKKEVDGIWLYNRSEVSLFVNSPTLEFDCKQRSPLVFKVLSGYSIKIFDYGISELLQNKTLKNYHYSDGPFDPYYVRISFAKGWGPCYTRQCILSCPCWLEVLLRVNR